MNSSLIPQCIKPPEKGDIFLTEFSRADKISGNKRKEGGNRLLDLGEVKYSGKFDSFKFLREFLMRRLTSCRNILQVNWNYKIGVPLGDRITQ